MTSKFDNLLDTVSLSLSNQESARQIVDLELDRIGSDPNNPRRTFDDDRLQELAISIEARGVIQPIKVRPAETEGRFIVYVGDRRFRAAKLAGLTTIPAIISEAGEENEVLVDQVIENDQRADLSAGEMAAAVARLTKGGLKQHEIAKQLGRPKALISMYASVASMPPQIAELANTLAIRTVYELSRAWKLDEARVGALLEARAGGSISTAEARALVQDIEDRAVAPDKSLSEQTAPVESANADVADAAGQPAPTSARKKRGKAANELPPLLVEVDGRRGRLVLTGKVAVLFDGAETAETIDASAIRPVG